VREKGREVPGCHARGSRVPSRHFRLEYRLDQCGSKCTLSFSLIKETTKIDLIVEEGD